MTDIVTGNTPQTIISGRNDGYHNDNSQRDIYPFLLMQRMEAGHADLVRDIAREAKAVEVAVEKTGAASVLAVEKVAAAAALQAATNAAAQLAAVERCCCEVKELIRAESAGVVARELAAAQAELLAIRFAAGNGNSARA